MKKLGLILAICLVMALSLAVPVAAMAASPGDSLLEVQLPGLLDQLGGTKLIVLSVLLLANFLGGLAVALYTKTFELKKVGDIFRAKVVPYVLGYLGVAVFTTAQPEFGVVLPMSWAALVAALGGSFFAHLKELGLNIPNPLAGPPVTK